MKVCVQCKWCQYKKEPEPDRWWQGIFPKMQMPAVCSHPESANPIYGHPGWASLARKPDGACGPEGKHWEAR